LLACVPKSDPLRGGHVRRVIPWGYRKEPGTRLFSETKRGSNPSARRPDMSHGEARRSQLMCGHRGGSGMVSRRPVRSCRLFVLRINRGTNNPSFFSLSTRGFLHYKHCLWLLGFNPGLFFLQIKQLPHFPCRKFTWMRSRDQSGRGLNCFSRNKYKTIHCLCGGGRVFRLERCNEDEARKSDESPCRRLILEYMF
jgi:hypothetical protein